jgi:hypothetical protein
MIACENSREFHLIANVLPLLRHSGAIRGIRFIRGPGDEAPTDYASPQERLIGDRVVVKEIEIFGYFGSH